MLHPVPDSKERRRLLRVVVMQRRLMGALCRLPPKTTVDQTWLQDVWPAIPAYWIQRFWTLPKDTSQPSKPGLRSVWIGTIAAAEQADKQAILGLIAEQLRFAELYQTPPTIRLTQQAWTQPVFKAVNELLKSFYDPLFYKDEGFPRTNGGRFHKDHLIGGFDPPISICPYTDNLIQDKKLDHFLPKDQFPMLSCHPDNLIPCSTDANSGSHKGTKVPLDLREPDQAQYWFHPRRRSAVGKYRLEFPSAPAPQPRVRFVALDANDQRRLDNMERLFGLSEFWGRFLDDEVQGVASDVQGWLKFDGKTPSEANVKDCVLQRASQERSHIGRRGLAIVKSFFYEHIANTPALLAQVVRICVYGT
jgi:hypothetical protein